MPVSIRETEKKMQVENLIVHRIVFLFSFSDCLLIPYKYTMEWGWGGAGKSTLQKPQSSMSVQEREIMKLSRTFLCELCSINPPEDVKAPGRRKASLSLWEHRSVWGCGAETLRVGIQHVWGDLSWARPALWRGVLRAGWAALAGPTSSPRLRASAGPWAPEGPAGPILNLPCILPGPFPPSSSAVGPLTLLQRLPTPVVP